MVGVKRSKRIISFVLVFLLALGIFIPANTTTADAASGITVAATYLPDYDPAGRSQVSKFIYNGELAFCVEHKKHNPE